MPQEFDRELLPKKFWRYSYEPANESVGYSRITVGCYVNGPNRVLSHEVFPLSDLPNDYVGSEDLGYIVANLVDVSAFQRFETLPDDRVGSGAVRPDFV